MTRLKKELTNKNILFDNSDSNDCYESYESFFICEKGFIITIAGSAMTDPEFRIYDRSLNLIGTQDCFKDIYYNPKLWSNYFNPFGSYCNFE